jgi:hypothetical protein
MAAPLEVSPLLQKEVNPDIVTKHCFVHTEVLFELKKNNF